MLWKKTEQSKGVWTGNAGCNLNSGQSGSQWQIMAHNLFSGQLLFAAATGQLSLPLPQLNCCYHNVKVIIKYPNAAVVLSCVVLEIA